MSKKLIAPNKGQGIPTHTTLPKHSVLVKKIRAQIKSELIEPISRANSDNYSLGFLIDAIRTIAEGGQPDPSRALGQIREMAIVCIAMSDDIGNQLYEVAYEKAPAILAAVGGEA